jgi:hypothetical protein
MSIISMGKEGIPGRTTGAEANAKAEEMGR